MDPRSFEKAGLFYLGKDWTSDQGVIDDSPVLYDAKDLTTHAVCVGMTGSGKTGLCIGLLEEALLDQIPVIVIDVKGDITNLMLTFPELRPEDFEPWIDPAEAAGKNRSVSEHAAATAEVWKNGIASYGQDGARIAALKQSADFTIYTPGSTAGVPISVLKSFDVPPREILDDGDLFTDAIATAVSGLLSLVGINPDPVQSKEYILLARIFEHFWREGSPVALQTMIRSIQNPPFKTIGIMDVETVFPDKDRLTFAMTINNLFASPSFSSWLKGEALDIQKLLYTAQGSPRCSIISIAHLSEKERMFFVSLLLNETVSWMRRQTGTGSLRAILYMDEVFGYFPPVANPPSKKPMLTLLKQARAYGLGVVLATQNPVDLDYKGLSNTGTWFIGRLQTERDKERVMDGLEGANAASGKSFDRKELGQIISGLGKRVFLMNNVHENEQALFHTRWVLSYLRGPLTRDHIRALTDEEKQSAAMETRSVAPGKAAAKADTIAPNAPDDLPVSYLLDDNATSSGDSTHLVAGLYATARLHFADKRRDLDYWQDHQFIVPLDTDSIGEVWDDAVDITAENLYLSEDAPDKASYSSLPDICRESSFTRSALKSFKDYLYRTQRLSLMKCAALGESAEAGESEAEFRIRLRQALSEQRDEAIEKLRDTYEKKAQKLAARIRTAEERVAREKGQYDQQKLQTVISLGSTLLGSLLGRRRSGTTTARGIGRSMRDRADYQRRKKDLERLHHEAQQLEVELADEIRLLQAEYNPENLELDTVDIPPRKSDIQTAELCLVWIEQGHSLKSG